MSYISKIQTSLLIPTLIFVLLLILSIINLFEVLKTPGMGIAKIYSILSLIIILIITILFMYAYTKFRKIERKIPPFIRGMLRE